MSKTRHNPERLSWKGRSYKAGTFRSYRVRRISELRERSSSKADRKEF